MKPLSRLSIISVFFAVILSVPLSFAQAVDKFNDAERQEIEEMIRSYIMENPQVILESVQQMKVQEEDNKKKQARLNLVKYRDLLVNDPNAPIIGNPKGDVTIVEFMDYRCGYCKRVFPTLIKAMNTDGNVRVLIKEFPILGPESVLASKAALAVWRLAPKKYEEFHTSLMQTKSSITESLIRSTAANVGLEGNAVIKEMKSSEIESYIGETRALAQRLGISGTPAFVIGNELVPGAIDLGTLTSLINIARGS